MDLNARLCNTKVQQLFKMSAIRGTEILRHSFLVGECDMSDIKMIDETIGCARLRWRSEKNYYQCLG